MVQSLKFRLTISNNIDTLIILPLESPKQEDSKFEDKVDNIVYLKVS